MLSHLREGNDSRIHPVSGRGVEKSSANSKGQEPWHQGHAFNPSGIGAESRLLAGSDFGLFNILMQISCKQNRFQFKFTFASWFRVHDHSAHPSSKFFNAQQKSLHLIVSL